ncbi:MAG: glycosyltransferase, partial [Patescibacteria group bacterium]
MNNIRVLMFGWELPPENSGGLGVACLGLSRKLNKKGVNLTFVVPRKKDSMKRSCFRLLSADVNYKEIEFNSPITPYSTPDSYKSVLKKEENNIYGENLFDEVLRYRQCAKEVALHEKFDVIHAHDWLSFGAGIVAKEATGKPLVAHVHATEFDRGGGVNINEKVYEKEREGMKKADKIVAVSNYTKNIIIEKYGI